MRILASIFINCFAYISEFSTPLILQPTQTTMSSLSQVSNNECKQEQHQAPVFPLVFNSAHTNPQQIVKKEEDCTDMIIHKQGNQNRQLSSYIQKFSRGNNCQAFLAMVVKTYQAQTQCLQQRVRLYKEGIRLQKEAQRLILLEKEAKKVLERRLTRLTEYEKKSIVEDYLPFNKNISQLANKYRVSRLTIKNYLRKAGLE